LLAVLVLAAGCQTSTTSLFTAAGPGWRVQEGQALWRPRRGYPELAGDLVAVTDQNGRCLLQFSKTPLTLVSAQVTSTNWLIQFPPQEMSFAGRGKPHARFLLLHLPAALASEPLPPPLRFERKPDGNWRLENPRTGETLEGKFFP
jgi:fermentation-respiration switch protein FrsA (DUF1100 family)